MHRPWNDGYLRVSKIQPWWCSRARILGDTCTIDFRVFLSSAYHSMLTAHDLRTIRNATTCTVCCHSLQFAKRRLVCTTLRKNRIIPTSWWNPTSELAAGMAVKCSVYLPPTTPGTQFKHPSRYSLPQANRSKSCMSRRNNTTPSLLVQTLSKHNNRSRESMTYASV